MVVRGTGKPVLRQSTYCDPNTVTQNRSLIKASRIQETYSDLSICRQRVKEPQVTFISESLLQENSWNMEV